LEKRGLQVVLTREPGGTPGAEAIRTLLLSNEGSGWNPRAEALLFAAARSDHVESLIRPALAAGKWVVCDRFVDSSRAYQGGGGGLSDADLLELHRIGSEGLLPDLTVLISVDPHVAEKRLRARDGLNSDRIGSRPPQYHARVAQAFARLAANDRLRFTEVNGDDSPAATHESVMQAIRAML
jgi:dTMP kinase